MLLEKARADMSNVMQLNSFLSRVLASFAAGPSPSAVAAVASVGNDAGDLDSLVSAIVYAEWQQAATRPSANVLFVPIAPFARRDFRLRTDATLLFGHCGVPLDAAGAPTSLLHLDEAAAAAAVWEGQLGVALTDHNACLPGVRAALGERVVAIVDHHNDERRHLLEDPEAISEAISEAAAAAAATAGAGEVAAKLEGTLDRPAGLSVVRWRREV